LRFEKQAIPRIEQPEDVIIRVTLAGLCGSDLHAYRGLEPFDVPYVTGHEFVGKVVALGESFGASKGDNRPSLYSTLKIGDKAQYVRVPHAGGTLFKFPPDDAPSSEVTTWDHISDASLILLGDILPTGYFAALQAIQHPNLAHAFAGRPFPAPSASLKASTVDTSIAKLQAEDCKLTFAVVGLGPVGLCVLVSLVELLGLTGVSNFNIIAIDPNQSRRHTAEAVLQAFGSTPGGTIRVVSLDDAAKTAHELSGGYGCDAVLEIVGNNSALEVAYELIRPFGVISSVGVHTHPQFPINGDALYSKNVSLSFGRCPVRSIFPYCVELLRSRQDIFSVGGDSGIISKIVPFEESAAKEAYKMFNEGNHLPHPRSSEMRYYQQKYPEVDDLVMVQVRQIAEMGAYVKLLEYDNIEGMILLSELSRRRIRSIQKLIRVGRNEVVVVLRVDKEKGYIDLSKRRVSPEDITKCEDKFMKSKAVASIMRHVATRTSGAVEPETPAKEAEAKSPEHKGEEGEEDEEEAGIAGGSDEEKLEELYEQIVWPLATKYGHTYDAFKLALTSSDVFEGLNIPQPVLTSLMSTIARRLTPQPIKLRADIELTCFQPAGIDAIKRALKAGEAVSTEAVPVKAKLVAPPFYVLGTNATDKIAAVERLEKAIEMIRTTIHEDGGELNVKMKPKAVSETEDLELAALMAKATKENEEVSGDSAEDSADE
ncbi:hypothetical protein FRC07_011197, partial [Ceratobasidium sp. 392]